MDRGSWQDDPAGGSELPDGEVGEIWLQGNNVGRGYWGLADETRRAFGAELRPPPAVRIHSRRSSQSAQRHSLNVSDVRFLPAGAVPRTTSGKLARRACPAEYFGGTPGAR